MLFGTIIIIVFFFLMIYGLPVGYGSVNLLNEQNNNNKKKISK